MMGHSHAVSGALAWTAAAPLIAVTTNIELSIPLYVAGALTTAGSALLPDLDHPQATISRTFGPLTQLLSVIVHALSGGHRRYTHTLLFVFLVGAALWGSLRFFPDTTVLVTVFLTTGLAFRGLHLAPSHGIKGWAIITALSIATTYWLINANTQWQWLPIAVALGCLIHCLGDACTPGGIPAWLPVSRRYVRFGLLPATGSWVESGVLTPIMGVAAAALAYLALA